MNITISITPKECVDFVRTLGLKLPALSTEEPTEAPTEVEEAPDVEVTAEEPTAPQETPETPAKAPVEEKAPETPTEEPEELPARNALKKAVNEISRHKGLNWIFQWLGECGVSSLDEIKDSDIKTAAEKLQKYE